MANELIFPTKGKQADKIKNYNAIFPTRLRNLRELAGVSQNEFATAIGVTRSTASLYESGVNLPDIATFSRIADFYSVSYDFLLGKSESKQRENIDIHEELGLSDEAIEVLKDFNEIYDGEILIPTVNYLLEQEKLDPFQVYGGTALLGVFPSEEYDETDKQEYKKLKNEHMVWKSQKHSPILSSISNYLKINLSDDKVFEITKSGGLEEGYTGPGYKPNYGTLKSVSKNDIIERILLLEIQERLQKAKDNQKEGDINGNNSEAR